MSGAGTTVLGSAMREQIAPISAGTMRMLAHLPTNVWPWRMQPEKYQIIMSYLMAITVEVEVGGLRDGWMVLQQFSDVTPTPALQSSVSMRSDHVPPVSVSSKESTGGDANFPSFPLFYQSFLPFSEWIDMIISLSFKKISLNYTHHFKVLGLVI